MRIIGKLTRVLPDKIYLQMLFFKHLHRFINFKNPKSFNEKLQCLKLYDRNPEYTIMVDKYRVKEYVASIIGEQYVIPTLGVWKHAKEIDFDKLPNRFVLKWNHDSGSVIVCKDKKNFIVPNAVKKLNKFEDHNAFWYGREWPYKNVEPKIIAEEYLENEGDQLIDYKFYCFNGVPEYCQVIRNRFTEETIDFYDMEWNLMPFVGLNSVARNGLNPVEKPLNLDLMINICHCLSKDKAFVRIDLYNVCERIYFGEITFYPASGFGMFRPKEWNEILGNKLFIKGR